jgi:hypothetical protein
MIRNQNALKLTIVGAKSDFVSSHGDNRYFEVFKQARNKIRKYDITDIVLGCLERLHSPDAETLENLSRQPPWNLLLLMKRRVELLDKSDARGRRFSSFALEVRSSTSSSQSDWIPTVLAPRD